MDAGERMKEIELEEQGLYFTFDFRCCVLLKPNPLFVCVCVLLKACVYTGVHMIDAHVGLKGEFRLLYNLSCILFIAFDQQNFPTEVIKFIL